MPESAPAAPSAPAPAPASTPAPSAAPSPSPSSASDRGHTAPPPAPAPESPLSRAETNAAYADAKARQQQPAQPQEPPTAPASGNKVTIGGVQYDENVLAARLAAEDSRKLTAPKAVEEYTPTLPADFQVPQGIEYKLNAQDPAFIAARQFALESAA
jgi:hypothetical protein